MLGVVSDNFPGFVRIDREGGRSAARHYVVHVTEPRFTVELTVEPAAPAADGAVLRRVCVPNSWAGDYGGYARWLTAAQEFFARSARPAANSPVPPAAPFPARSSPRPPDRPAGPQST